MSRPAVFLDRDGTINVERDYLARVDDVELLPGALDALRLLHDRGYTLVVVTNQSGIARGYYGPNELARIHEAMREMTNGLIAGWFHCPHHPDAGEGGYVRECDCRKPRAGLLTQAMRVLDLTPAWMIGDSARDAEAGAAVGCETVLVRTGKPVDEQLAKLGASRPTIVADDLLDAARRISRSRRD